MSNPIEYAYLTEQETIFHRKLNIYFTAFINPNDVEEVQNKYSNYFKLVYDNFLYTAIERDQSDNALYLPKLIYLFVIYLLYLGMSWYIFDYMYHVWCLNYQFLFICFFFLSSLVIFMLKIFIDTLLLKQHYIFHKKRTDLIEKDKIDDIDHLFHFKFCYNETIYRITDLMNRGDSEFLSKQMESIKVELFIIFLGALTIPVYLSIQNISVNAIYKNDMNNTKVINVSS